MSFQVCFYLTYDPQELAYLIFSICDITPLLDKLIMLSLLFFILKICGVKSTSGSFSKSITLSKGNTRLLMKT